MWRWLNGLRHRYMLLQHCHTGSSLVKFLKIFCKGITGFILLARERWFCTLPSSHSSKSAGERSGPTDTFRGESHGIFVRQGNVAEWSKALVVYTCHITFSSLGKAKVYCLANKREAMSFYKERNYPNSLPQNSSCSWGVVGKASDSWVRRFKSIRSQKLFSSFFSLQLCHLLVHNLFKQSKVTLKLILHLIYVWQKFWREKNFKWNAWESKQDLSTQFPMHFSAGSNWFRD